MFYRGREYRETDFLTGHTDKPVNVSFKTSRGHGGAAGDSIHEAFQDMPRKTPPRPANSPGRVGDLSSIQGDPFDGM